MKKTTSFLILALIAVIPAAAGTPLSAEAAAEEMLTTYIAVLEARLPASPDAGAFCSGSPELTKSQITSECWEWLSKGVLREETANNLEETMRRVNSSIDTYSLAESAPLIPLIKRIAAISKTTAFGGYSSSCVLYPDTTFIAADISTAVVAAGIRVWSDMPQRLDTVAMLASFLFTKLRFSEAKNAQAAALLQASQVIEDKQTREALASLVTPRAPTRPEYVFKETALEDFINIKQQLDKRIKQMEAQNRRNK